MKTLKKLIGGILKVLNVLGLWMGAFLFIEPPFTRSTFTLNGLQPLIPINGWACVWFACSLVYSSAWYATYELSKRIPTHGD